MTDQQTSLTVIILAAGKGSRMHSDLPKVMHPLAGRPMIEWILDTVEELNPAQIITVTGPNMESLEEVVKDYTIARQDRQQGTGDAVRAALPHIQDKNSHVLILLGDEPFVPADALDEMISHPQPSIMAFHADDPTGFGRMVQRADASLLEIVEEKDATPEQKEISLCNAGNFCLPYAQLESWLAQVGNDNAQGEYYLTDLPVIAAKDGASFAIIEVEAEHGWGINDRTQLAVHERYIQDILRVEAMQSGVTMIDPLTTYLSWDTEFGRDIVIEPNVFFGAGVRVSQGAHIKAFSHLEQCIIGKNSIIGPFARLRPGADLAENVKVGNFVEVKNAKLAKGVKANHHGYIGDADIGAGTNFGCGAITVNYDGYQKHKTVIGENVMIGSNASLIAPITIGDDAFIAAGSTISDNVPADALGMARPKLDIKESWIEGYRKARKKK